MVYFSILVSEFVGNLLFFFFKIGAVDVKLTEEEKKELEGPYTAQAAVGHS